MELQNLNRLLETSDIQEFEYVCLIDVRSRKYSVFSHDGENSHMVPETADFDAAAKHIRDTVIPAESRDAYYDASVLDHVLKRMGQSDGHYSFRYTMIDGVTRKVRFSWYEGTRMEIFMTVHKITGASPSTQNAPDSMNE